MASGHFSCLRVAVQQLMLHVRVFLQLLCARCDENDPILFFIVGTAHVVVSVAFNLYTTVLVVPMPRIFPSSDHVDSPLLLPSSSFLSLSSLSLLFLLLYFLFVQEHLVLSRSNHFLVLNR